MEADVQLPVVSVMVRWIGAGKVLMGSDCSSHIKHARPVDKSRRAVMDHSVVVEPRIKPSWLSDLVVGKLLAPVKQRCDVCRWKFCGKGVQCIVLLEQPGR